jgi:hypothetical protein
VRVPLPRLAGTLQARVRARRWRAQSTGGWSDEPPF